MAYRDKIHPRLLSFLEGHESFDNVWQLVDAVIEFRDGADYADLLDAFQKKYRDFTFKEPGRVTSFRASVRFMGAVSEHEDVVELRLP